MTNDVIIVLPNAGEAVTQAIASQIPGVDLVIGAAGNATPRSVQTDGAMLVQADQASPGHAGRFVGSVSSSINSTNMEVYSMRITYDPKADAMYIYWLMWASG